MDITKKQADALSCCMDIALEHTEDEVEKYGLPSTQEAWKIGREALDYQAKIQTDKLKDFKL